LSISKIIQLYKGSSSNWINKNNFLNNQFYWARGYGAFTVSDSGVTRIARYIANQEEHHKKETFEEEYDKFIKLCNNRKR
jgi:putative transposase